ncbi:MAG: AtzE family amidohydrolase [Pseudomonadota bacterium]|nr:AtzE family amidohydrolase [Pseudomonadota bacterium]
MKRATDIADVVRSGRVTALAVAEECLDRLAYAEDLCAVTRVLTDRARQEARDVDAAVRRGSDPGPLAGVPYGVKDLFDVTGLPTTAGSAIYADARPAAQDAEAIRRLRDAGAVLVATLNMDEFAYGFATINARHGTTRNPHDRARLAGGSSGGSAAAVAAGLLAFSLGSDTNGSIRVPASLTGLYGLKPTHGGLPMGGTFPFADSFDDIGPFTTSLGDMGAVWQVLSAQNDEDDGAPIRMARLGGRFRENARAAQLDAIDAIAGDAPLIALPDIARARSAAFLITAYEGGVLHREALNREAMRFDPATRDRLIAGALVPRGLYEQARAFRAELQARVAVETAGFDVFLAPATPCEAPLIADPQILIDGALRPARADLGIHTQPISFLGLPSLAVPLLRPGQLPLGLQLIGQPGGEAKLFRCAAALEQAGFIGVTAPVSLRLEETT